MRRRRAGWDIRRHASSYTTQRCPPLGSRRADSIHADAHVISTETRVAFSVTRERSREIIGNVGSNRTVDGPSNRPARSPATRRSEEHTSELQSLMRLSYAVFCLQKKKK